MIAPILILENQYKQLLLHVVQSAILLFAIITQKNKNS